jgi:hypothetical protein
MRSTHFEESEEVPLAYRIRAGKAVSAVPMKNTKSSEKASLRRSAK